MMSRFVIFLFLVVLVLPSCSGSGNPVTPSSQDNQQMIVNDSDMIANSDMTNPYRGVFGAWKVHVDPQNLSYEITPSRNAHKIGDTFDADLLQFLTVSPCANCIRITGLSLDTLMRLSMDVGVKHPFNDITRRPDLHGFDVRLIFLMEYFPWDFDDIKTIKTDGTEESVVISPYTLLNEDGYTSHYDDIVNDPRYFINGSDMHGNINPFIRYFENPSTGAFDPHAPSGYNVMPVGSSFEVKKVYFGYLILEPFDFYVVADVAYGQSAVLANRTNPQYYLPSFNRTEPWRVEYWLENNNLNDTDPNSTVDVMVQVFDWQHSATVDPNYPNSSNLSGVRESSKVLRLELSVPGYQNDPVVADTPLSGDGSPTNPLKYRMKVKNENLFTSSQLGLLSVRDELYGKASPSGRLPVPDAPAGFPYGTDDIRDYSIYEIVYINYPNPSNQYLNEIDIDKKYQFLSSMTDDIAVRFFMDPGGVKYKYYWKNNYEGGPITDYDVEGNPTPQINFGRGGRFDLGLKVELNTVPKVSKIYEIPIWVNGEAFNQPFQATPTPKKDTTSITRNSSIAMSSKYYYCGFVSEAGGKLDSWLAVGDEEGNFTSRNITGSILASNCFFPAIIPIEDGIHDRLIMLFNSLESGKWELYSIWGNLDGSGFDSSHMIKLPTSRTYNSWTKLLFRSNKVFAYYWTANNPLNGQIEVAYSDNYGEAWTIHPTLIDSGTSGKWDPTPVYSSYSYRTYILWCDTRNSTTTGPDLYMAESLDGLSFNPSRNISGFDGNILEAYPEAGCSQYTIACAYLADSNSDSKNEVWVKFINASTYAFYDHFLTYYGTTLNYTKPSLDMVSNNRVFVTYSAYFDSTNKMKTYVLQLTNSGFTYLSESQLFIADTSSAISSDIVNLYTGPAVKCKSLVGGEGIEAFAVWPTYLDGMENSTGPINLYLGGLNAFSEIIDMPN